VIVREKPFLESSTHFTDLSTANVTSTQLPTLPRKIAFTASVRGSSTIAFMSHATTQVSPKQTALDKMAHLQQEPHLQADSSVATSENTTPPLDTRGVSMCSCVSSTPPRSPATGTEAIEDVIPTSRTPTVPLLNTLVDSPPPEQVLIVDAPISPTPNSERPSSPITFDNWNGRVQTAKDLYYNRGRIFSKTHQMIRHNTSNMNVVASRGFERAGYLPVRRTVPAMHKRIYSIDVVTEDWEKGNMIGWLDSDNTVVDPIECPREYYEEQPSIQREPTLSLPNPLRHEELSKRSTLAYYPPYDTETYINLGDSILTNEYFHHILHWEKYYAWMDDSILNTALEALRLEEDCDAHDIGMINTDIAQVCYMAYKNRNSDESRLYFSDYRHPLEDKKWMFVPINDGTVNDEAQSTASGSHWSLVVVDRIHKRCYYYDSFIKRENTPSYIAAERIFKGLLLILGENIREWTWKPQENSPDQWEHNTFGIWRQDVWGYGQWKRDDGPCGPFVWTMCGILIKHIKNHQADGNELECSLDLPDNFPASFQGCFNSYNIRVDMQCLIAKFKLRKDIDHLIQEHDQAAFDAKDSVLSIKSPVVFCPPPAPVQGSSPEAAIQADAQGDGGIALGDSQQSGISLVNVNYDGLSDALMSLSDSTEDIRSTGSDDLLFEDEINLRHRHKRQKSD
jgi:hypothetical protein